MNRLIGLKKAPLISIVTLTYRKFDYLKESINSIFAQSYPNIELILCDDGSENYDANLINSIIKEKTKNIKELKILRNVVNSGIVKSLNRSIIASKGKYIIALSSDDCFCNEQVIFNIVDEFEKDESINVITTFRECYSEDFQTFIEKKPLINEVAIIQQKPIELLKYIALKGNIISGASTYYRKSYLEKSGFFNEKYRLLEDFPFYLRMLRKGDKIKFLNISTIKYRYGGVSTLNEPNPYIIKDHKLIAEEEILKFNFLNKREKRKVFYKRVLSKNEKLKIINIFNYFDLFAISVIKFFFNHRVSKCS